SIWSGRDAPARSWAQHDLQSKRASRKWFWKIASIFVGRGFSHDMSCANPSGFTVCGKNP
ncbi:MAG TPA: hypothetical protein VIG89_05810, partial [Candidatus Acidoferrales bacterium]